jgi:hypothetical protein
MPYVVPPFGSLETTGTGMTGQESGSISENANACEVKIDANAIVAARTYVMILLMLDKDPPPPQISHANKSCRVRDDHTALPNISAQSRGRTETYRFPRA